MKQILFDLFKLAIETSALETRLFRPHTRIFNNQRFAKELISKFEQALDDKLKKCRYVPYDDSDGDTYTEPTIDRYISSLLWGDIERETANKINELCQSSDKVLGSSYSLVSYDAEKIRKQVKREKIDAAMQKILKSIMPTNRK